MKPMFSYFGSKYKLAKLYGAPRHDTVIEPFAGSAAYSLYWEPKNVILFDKSPIIVSIWNYLITASEKQIMDLPTDFEVIADCGLEYGADFSDINCDPIIDICNGQGNPPSTLYELDKLVLDYNDLTPRKK